MEKIKLIPIMLENMDSIIGSRILDGIKNELSEKAYQRECVCPHYLRSLSRALAYIRERQTCLSRLASGKLKLAMSSTHFKSAVVDEFIFDDEDQRNLILEYLIDRDAYFAGMEIVFSAEKNINLNTVSVDLPGGFIGRQTIFVILENIILESVEYNSRLQYGKIIFNIKIEEYDGDFLLRIWDNLGVGDKAIKHITKWLRDPIRQIPKRIREMRIAASLLEGELSADVFEGNLRYSFPLKNSRLLKLKKK